MDNRELRNGLAEEGIELTPEEVTAARASLANKFRVLMPELEDHTDDEIIDIVVRKSL